MTDGAPAPPGSPPAPRDRRKNGAPPGPSSRTVVRCGIEALEDWISLRRLLWPDPDRARHEADVRRILETPARSVGYMALSGATPVGMAEASLRFDYVNGCETSPATFLEGLFVRREWRRSGAARQLCRAIELWGAGHGCGELASDTATTNLVAQRAHRALGFEETERVVFYRKRIRAHA